MAATDALGNPIAVGDGVTLTGKVVSVSGDSQTCTLTVTLYRSGNTITITGGDVTSHTQNT